MINIGERAGSGVPNILNVWNDEGFVEQEIEERFALIDDELVWHGGMNLLGKVDVWDNLMRIKSQEVAAELLEMSIG